MFTSYWRELTLDPSFMENDSNLVDLCAKYKIRVETIHDMVECERQKQGLGRKHGLPAELRKIIEREVNSNPKPIVE